MAKPHDDYAPLSQFLGAFPDVSGNEVNGLGETLKQGREPGGNRREPEWTIIESV